MTIQTSTSFPCRALAVMLLLGCGTANSTAPEATQSSTASVTDNPSQPIWAPTDTPRPLARVILKGGASQTIDISGSVLGTITSVDVAKVQGAEGIHVVSKGGTLLEATAPLGTDAEGVVELVVRTANGQSHSIGFPLVARPMPEIRFTFKPSGNTKPSAVAVAGKFNGWSPTANPMMTHNDDGTWEALVAMEAGEWPYKFVVDGEWILDPANSNVMDDGGHENSKIVVLGEQSKAGAPLAISPLSAHTPGVGNQGGFKVAVSGGSQLESGGVRVFVNNAPLPASAYRVDPETGVIALEVPEAQWGPEQFVLVTARDSSGRSGSLLAPFDFSAASRAPKDETIYYVVLDRFKNGDPSNDAPTNDPDVVPLNDFMGGDIAGVRQMIEAGYFNDLGVTTLWISPHFVQPNIAYRDSKPPFRKLTGYHGYWPVEMRDTEPRWGSMDEFEGMVEDAHRHGLAVIIDFVSNHLHDTNPLVNEHPDWFSKLELPDGTQNIRQYDAHPYTTWFDTFLPDIAYDQSPAATEYMSDTAVWLIKRTGADGFRHDAVKHVPNVFWEMCSAKLTERIIVPEQKRLYQVGETVSSRATINQFIGPGLLDGQFDFPLFWSIEDTLAWERADLKVLAKSLQDSMDQYPPDAIMSPFLGNHDVPRFMGKAEYDNKPGKKQESEEEGFTNPAKVDDLKSYDKLQIATAFLLTIPGAPMIYYGDEIGMTGSGRPDSRRPFILQDQWDEDQKATFTVVRDFTLARQASIALRRGSYQLLHVDAENLAYARVAPEETAVVVIRRNPTDEETLSVPLPEAWGRPKSCEALALKGIATDDGKLTDGGVMEVRSGPYAAGVWLLKW